MLRLSLFIVSAVYVAHVTADCNSIFLDDNTCAVLFDEPNCKDKLLDLKEGEQELPFTADDDAESVVVRKGCTFRGYDHDGKGTGLSLALGLKDSVEEAEDRGDFIVVRALNDANANTEFTGDVDEEISFVSCRCGNTGPNGRCAVVPPYLCAVCYDKHGCDKGGWDNPLEIPETSQLDLSLLSRYFTNRNDIESCTVRRGCTLRGYDDTGLDGSDGSITITADKTGDKTVDLKGKEMLQNDIESLSCVCPK